MISKRSKLPDHAIVTYKVKSVLFSDEGDDKSHSSSDKRDKYLIRSSEFLWSNMWLAILDSLEACLENIKSIQSEVDCFILKC